MPRGHFDRTPRRAQTRARLLQAAARVFARRGFEGASLDEVAEEAGFTKGAVYDHFGSRENLLLALLDERLAEQIAEQRALFNPDQATRDRPRAGADRWIAQLGEDPEAFQLFVEAWVRGQRDERLRGRVAAGLESWTETLRSFGRARTKQAGLDVPEDLLEPVATVMLALGIGMGMMRLADPDFVPARLLGASYALLLAALETTPDARELLRDVAGSPSSESAATQARAG